MSAALPVHRPALDPDVLLPLREFLGMLPGVHIRKSVILLTDAWYDALVMAEPVRIGELGLGAADGDELFVARDTGVTCVSPSGAARLTDAYRKGFLPRVAGASKLAAEPSAAALLYAESQADLALRSAERAVLRQAEASEQAARRAEFEHLVAHPEVVPEDRFTYELLDTIFWRHLGPGSGALAIGGVMVSKAVVPYASNSGKSRDHAVRFEWSSAAGTARSLDKPSRFADNRRNDPTLDWGLPG